MFYCNRTIDALYTYMRFWLIINMKAEADPGKFAMELIFTVYSE